MYDARLVKTYTPVLRGMEGSTGLDVKGALYDIVLDMGEQKGVLLSDEEIVDFVLMYIRLTEIDHWIDGDYEIFPGYVIKIKKMSRHNFERLPEFAGY